MLVGAGALPELVEITNEVRGGSSRHDGSEAVRVGGDKRRSLAAEGVAVEPDSVRIYVPHLLDLVDGQVEPLQHLAMGLPDAEVNVRLHHQVPGAHVLGEHGSVPRDGCRIGVQVLRILLVIVDQHGPLLTVHIIVRDG